MELFEKYCFPSVMAQDSDDFEWILLMDAGTPQWCIDRMDALKKICAGMKTVYVSRENSRHFAAVFKEAVSGMKGDCERVITTYLDNDDAISRSFVREVRSAADKVRNGTVISFFRGYQYFCDIRMATMVEYPNNHFISLVESAEDPRTVFGYGSHISIDRLLAVRMIDRPGWIEVVHGNNVDNDVKMTIHTTLVSDTESLAGEFGPSFVLDEHPMRLFLCGWVPKMLRHASVRVKQKLKGGRDWWN